MMTKSAIFEERIQQVGKPGQSFVPSERPKQPVLDCGPPPNATPRLLTTWLVDDDAKIRELVAALLCRTGGVDCTRDFNSAETVLEALASEEAPDVILLDANMKGMSGIDAVGPIKRLASRTRVFILTTFYDQSSEERALAGGASGFLLKRDPPEEWLAAIVTPFLTRPSRERLNPGP